MAARKFVRHRGNQQFQGNRNNRRQHLKNKYSRKTDCWNCGSRNHIKDFCPRPSTLKCSYCQTPNVRTDRCPCRRPTAKPGVAHPVPNKYFQNKADIAIFVRMYGKTVRALMNPSVQETVISRSVANWVKEQTDNPLRKLILRNNGKLKLVSCISMTMYTRQHMQITIDGVIDDGITEKIIILGSQAFLAFGHQIYIGGQQSKMRVRPAIATIEVRPRENLPGSSNCARGPSQSQNQRPTQRAMPAFTTRRREDNEEDDRISFLDEEEARQIREWN